MQFIYAMHKEVNYGIKEKIYFVRFSKTYDRMNKVQTGWGTKGENRKRS